MEKTFIFDYDDTLAPNQHYYNYAQLDFAGYVIDKLGYKSPDAQSIINIQVEIDVNNVKKLGTSMERFPTSLRDAFIQISENRQYTYTDDELQKVYDIGMKAFDIKQGLIKTAAEVLDFLTVQKDELILYTKGDKIVQNKKIKINKIHRWFQPENIHIVDEKRSDYLETIVRERDKDKTFKVGNSIRSDVNPALEIGIKVIYIPCETWQYEREHNGIDKTNPRIFKFNNIKDIISEYEHL